MWQITNQRYMLGMFGIVEHVLMSVTQ